MAFKTTYGNGKLGDVDSVATTINSCAQVTAVNSTSITIDATNRFSGDVDFVAGEKILLHVSASVAGEKAYLGKYLLTDIVEVNGGILTLTDDPTTCITSEELANYYVQAVAVAQYKNLTLSTGTAISPTPFSTTKYCGGIIALMCSETLTFDGGHISLSDKGIPTTSKELRPVTNNDVQADTATYAGWENSDTHIHFMLNSGDGAAFIIAKRMVCSDDSRIGNVTTYGCQFYRGNSDSVTYGETPPSSITNVGGSTILIAAETIENFGHKMLAKYRNSASAAGQGICRCYIASETKLRNDEGLYAYDCISKPARVMSKLNIKNFGNGSFGDASGYTLQLNNYAKITAVSGKKVTYTGATTTGLAQITAGALVMIHFNHKGNTYVEHAGKFILANVLKNDGSELTLDTDVPDISITDYVAQVVSIPQFDNFTLAATNSATPVFDGEKGGICAIVVKNNCDLSEGKFYVNAGNKFAYAREGLGVIGNAQDSDKLPIGQGFGSVFILAKNLTVNANTRIGATGGGTTPFGYSTKNFYSDNYGTVSSLPATSGANSASACGGYGSNGNTTGNAFHQGTPPQGAHILIIANRIAGFNQSFMATGGNGDSAGLGGSVSGWGGNVGFNYNAGLSVYFGSGSASGWQGGGSSGWAFIYCKNAVDQDTTGTILEN